MTFKNPIHQEVYNSYIASGIPSLLAYCMLMQNIFETANYTSNVFKKYNNTGGMKWTGKYPQSYKGGISPEGNYYAGYKSAADSATDQANWYIKRLASFKDVKDLTSFAAILKRYGYYTDTQERYTAGLIAVSKKYV